MKFPSFLSIIIISLFLVSCGNNGGGSSPPTPDDNNGTKDVELSNIIIESESGTLPIGQTMVLSAKGIYSDSSAKDISSEINWSSNDENIVTISNDSGSSGIMSAVAKGHAVITAEYDSVSAVMQIDVTDAVLQSIQTSSDSLSLASGTKKEITLTGIFTDNSQYNITDKVVWTFSTANIVSIDSDGTVSGLSLGTTSATAEFQGEQSNPITITVSNAEVTSLEISSMTDEIPTGITIQFSATAFFSDGSEQDVTQSTFWQTDDTSIATISNLKINAGQFNASSPGDSTITAEYMGYSDAKTVVVKGGTLVSLRTNPPVISLDTTKTIPLKLEGLYTYNGEYQVYDLTEQAYWISVDQSVLTINNSSGSKGIGTPVSAGETQVAIILGSMAIINDVTVFKQINSISIEGSTTSIPVGSSAVYNAVAEFNDGSTEDVTDKILWNSSDTSIAAAISPGEYKAISTGGIDVSIVMNGTEYDSTNLSVTIPEIVSIQISFTAIGDYELQLEAIGKFNNDLYANITENVTWSSSNESVITINNAQDSKGRAHVYTTGECIVTATADNGVHGDLTIKLQ